MRPLRLAAACDVLMAHLGESIHPIINEFAGTLFPVGQALRMLQDVQTGGSSDLPSTCKLLEGSSDRVLESARKFMTAIDQLRYHPGR